MAYSTINKSSQYFNTNLVTGTTANQTITGMDFQPDWVWSKVRSETGSARFVDSVRGVTKYLFSGTDAEATSSNNLTACTSDGYTLYGAGSMNENTRTYAQWCWKAGTTSGLSGGTITPSSYSFNTTSKFGVYTYTGNGVSGATVPHGLGAVPTLIIVKRRDSTSSWQVMGNGTGQPGPTSYGKLNSTDGFASNINRWNNTAPTTSVFSLGNSTEVNGNGGTYVAYVFCNVPGYFESALYQGNNNSDGTFIFTGGKPKLIMIRPNIAGKNWFMYDSERLGMNSGGNATTNKTLWASSSASEATVGTYKLDILSNGFKIRETGTDTNGTGNSYQYWCWMQPLVGSNNIATTAR